MARWRKVLTAIILTSLVCTSFFVYMTGHPHEKLFQRSVSNSSQRHTSEKILPAVDSITLPADVQLPRISKVKIIIVTYMRSGSTFTGDIFDYHPDVFYLFEPLHSIDDIHSLGSLHFWDSEPLNTATMDDDEIARFKESIIQQVLSCSFRAMPPKVLMDPFQVLGKKMRMYHKCVSAQPGILGPLKCLPLLQRLCFESKVAVIKTIRLSLEETLTLMEKDPEVKVIHLLRDPRGTLLSRSKLDGSKVLLRQFCKDFCRRVQEDLSHSEEALSRHPGRVLRVRYEDIALNPVHYAQKLLDFAGLTLGEAQEKHLHRITGSKVTESPCPSCVNVRATNSSVQASAWREHCEVQVTRGIDEQCSQVYARAGYLPLSSEAELRDRTVPSMLPTGFVPGFVD